MFPPWLSSVLSYFSLYGFRCFDNTSQIRKKFIRILMLSIQMALSCWCAQHVLEMFWEISNLMGHLDVLNFIIFYTNGSFAYFTIIFESYANQNGQKEIWTNLSRINGALYSDKNIKLCCYLTILVVEQISRVLISLFAIAFERMSRSADKLMDFLLANIILNRQFFYALHLKMIKFHLQNVEAELKYLQSNGLHSHNEKRVLIHLKSVQTSCALVYKTSAALNQVFGWSQLTFITLNFHALVTFLNFFYRQMTNKFNGFNYGL